MHIISAVNAPQALEEALWQMKANAKEEDSRNDKVMVMPGPTMIEIERSTERVIFCPVRNANPFFHVMEFVWMMAGENEVTWIEKFNSRIREYADKNSNISHGAYGARWARWFGRNQILDVISLIRSDPTTRRAVLGMWDPRFDLDPHNDLPCNTHIYFRNANGFLDMTVCNRSNDLIWGALGANVVHMTLLHELVARAVCMWPGKYRVFTNNLHMYKDRPDFEPLWDHPACVDFYGDLRPMVLLRSEESADNFMRDCQNMLMGHYAFRCKWMTQVALPMYHAYMERKNKQGDGLGFVKDIQAQDWKMACKQWIERKDEKV